ncbi:hypothetical protein MKW94_015750, partial [Papaver nudicaule]|nr:hypothetical protein [Papaver nudicaule]
MIDVDKYGVNIIYNIICNNSYLPLKPFMNANGSYLEIISVSETEVRIRNSFTNFIKAKESSVTDASADPVLRGILNADGFTDEIDELFLFNLDNTPFMVSYAKNKLYGIGCGLVAVLIDDLIGTGDVISRECQTSCGNIREGSCSGSGCCQTTFPKGFKSFSLAVNGTPTNSTVGRFVVLAEIGQYTFDSVDLTLDAEQIHKKYEKKVIPVVLDWTVGDETCEEAKMNPRTYACQGNYSVCSDINNGQGYRCTCPDGYEGNPYLRPGCKDVDECDDPNNNPCVGICINTIGGYSCSCPDGSKGDARTNGSKVDWWEDVRGCTFRKKQFPVLTVALGNFLVFIKTS